MTMNLKQYFQNNNGVGVLSTANTKGEIGSAVYAKPHIFDPGKIAFIMRDRRSHANLMENPHAEYLFVESETKSKGIRLQLEMTETTDDTNRIDALSRRDPPEHGEQRFLTTFTIKKALKLIGPDEISLH